MLARLRAQYVSEDAKTPDITDNDKVRRYQSILREGAWLEQQYAQAANLYQVRALMLAAAKGLAVLDNSDQARQCLMELAERMAQTAAPPDVLLPADLLVTRACIEELADDPEAAVGQIEQFLARYERTAAEHSALMCAATLCRTVGENRLRRDYLARLNDKYIAAPGVAEFLAREGMNPYLGRLMIDRLPALDGLGETVCLPRDAFGKVTLLCFWSLAKSAVQGRRGDSGLKAAYQDHRNAGLEIIGVNLDADRAQVVQFVRENGLAWRQVFSGLGMNDPTYQRYRPPTVPAFWLIGPFGHALANSYDYQSPARLVGNAINGLDSHAEIIARAPYYRSGEFLLDRLNGPAGAPAGARDVPADELAAVRDKLSAPPSLGLTPDAKADLFGQALQLARAAEAQYPRAANLTPLRASMLVAARWLAAETRDPDRRYAAEARRLADGLANSDPPQPARLLADYVLLAADLAAKDFPQADVSTRVSAFVRAHESGELAWAAGILGVVLALECGNEAVLPSLIAPLRDRFADSQPKVRGFLRDFCLLNVDARAAYTRARLVNLPPPPRRPAGTDSAPDTPTTNVAIVQPGVSASPPSPPGPASTAPAGPPQTQPATQPRKSKPPPPPSVARTVAGTLVCLDGRTLRLPDDLRGKVVTMHFWSVARPPVVPALQSRRYSPTPGEMAPDPAHAIVVVGVNLDRDRDQMEAFLADKPAYKDWIHVFSGRGWDDPLARDLDVYRLPRSVLIDREGLIYRWGTPGGLGNDIPLVAGVPRQRHGWDWLAPWPPPPATQRD